MRSKRSTAFWLKSGGITLAVFLSLGYVARNRVLGVPVDAYAATTAELSQSVVASGRVLTPQRVAVAADITGRVRRIPVAEGQRVVKGEVLIELDDANERAGLALAAAMLAESVAALRQLREVALPVADQSLRLAQANAVQAESHWQRARALRTNGYVTQAELEDAQRNHRVAVSQLDAAQLQKSGSTVQGSVTAQLQAALERNEANLSMAQVHLIQGSIVAPADGVLIARAVEPGEIVQTGQVLMQLAVAGEIQIALQIDEKNLSKLALSQSAIGSADAYPHGRFHAIVAYINPAVDPVRGSVAIKLRVLDPPEYLRQDMTVSVDILTAHRERTLVILAGALHDAGSDSPWVLVVRQRRLERQAVRLGLLGDDRVEVLDGLADGEPLILANLLTASAGQRVRVRMRTFP